KYSHPLDLHSFLHDALPIFPDAAQTGSEVRAFCQAHGFNFPVYRDPERKATKRFGSRVTPEAFVLDGAGKLVYHGSLNELVSARSEEHTSELQSQSNLVCRL